MSATTRDRFLNVLSRINPRFGKQYIDIIMKTGASASNTFLSDVSIWLTEGLGLKTASEALKAYLNLNDGPFQLHRVKNDDILSDNFGKPTDDNDFINNKASTLLGGGGIFSHDEHDTAEESDEGLGTKDENAEEVDEDGNFIQNKESNKAADWMNTSWVVRYDVNDEFYKVPILEGDAGAFTEGTIFATVQVEDKLAWIKSKGSPLRWWEVRELRSHSRTLLLENSAKKGEYKEVHLIQLFGAFVRRTNIYGKNNLDDSGVNLNAGCDITFQLPQPDFNVLYKCLLDIVHDCEQAEIDHPAPTTVQAQSRAAGKVSTLIKSVWNKEKDDQLKAKLLVQDLDSSVVADREAWLTVGRMLRLLSRGGSELLQPWIDWTRKCIKETKASQGKEITPTGCKNIWNAFRPHTNCDDDAVVNLRSFFKAYDFSSKHSGEKILAENTVCLSLEEIKKEILGEINPKRQAKMLRQMEQVFAVAESIDTKEIFFLPSVLESSLSETSISPKMSSYEESGTYVMSEQFSIDINASQASEPSSVAVGSIRATIIVGDMLRLPKLAKFNKDSGKSVSADWFKVVEVDVIFARIRIVTSFEPPYCWINKIPKDMLPFWIPIANLWNILVIRTISSLRKVDTSLKTVNGNAEYRSFITPMDFTPDYALAYISSLPSAPKSSPPCEKDPKSIYKIETQVLQTNSDSIVITWTLQNLKTKKYIRSDSECELLWIISICPALYNPSSIMPWKEIYKGTGEACQITSLLPLSQYQIKVEARIRSTNVKKHSSIQLYRYGLHATLAERPLYPPDVHEWFAGASYGKVRLVGHAVPFETTNAHTIPIPEGCYYIFEIYMRETLKNSLHADRVDGNESRDEEQHSTHLGNENNDTSNFTNNTVLTEKNTDNIRYGDSPFDELFSSRDAAFQGSFQTIGINDEDIDHSVPLPEGEGKDGWKIIGRCRNGRLNSVITISRYRNPVIWLRTRVLNQEGLASEPSKPLVFKLSSL